MKTFEIEYDLGFAVVICKNKERAKELFIENHSGYEIIGITLVDVEVFYDIEK